MPTKKSLFLRISSDSSYISPRKDLKGFKSCVAIALQLEFGLGPDVLDDPAFKTFVTSYSGKINNLLAPKNFDGRKEQMVNSARYAPFFDTEIVIQDLVSQPPPPPRFQNKATQTRHSDKAVSASGDAKSIKVK